MTFLHGKIKKDIEKNENDDDDDNDYLFYHGDD